MSVKHKQPPAQNCLIRGEKGEEERERLLYTKCAAQACLGGMSRLVSGTGCQTQQRHSGVSAVCRNAGRQAFLPLRREGAREGHHACLRERRDISTCIHTTRQQDRICHSGIKQEQQQPQEKVGQKAHAHTCSSSTPRWVQHNVCQVEMQQAGAVSVGKCTTGHTQCQCMAPMACLLPGVCHSLPAST